MSRSLNKLLRVRRLMEDISRAEFAARRMEQTKLEERREDSRRTALALRSEARAVMVSGVEAAETMPGLWRRLLDDSERSGEQAEWWERAARQAEARAAEAERKYMDERRSRMQAEIVVRERAAAERVEQQRREQREIDDWFGMGRRARLRRARSEDSPI